MLNETYRGMLAHKSVIRETFMYGKQRAAQIGYENVFDYSLGNPSVPCPERFTAAMQELLAQEDPVALHGYCPSQGDPEFRTAVAAHLNRTFGLPYAQKDIFPTTGAAGAIAHAVRAVTRPGDEVLTFAPYFPEYGPYVEGTGAHLRVVPPQAPAFQPNLEAFEQMLTEKVTCVLINTPNNPTGRLVDGALLRAAAEQCRAVGAVLAVDECFLPLSDGAGPGLAPCLAEHPNLLLLRAFTKSYAMAGLRLGYALSANGGLLERMAAAGPPWSVSTPAQAAGLAALEQCPDWPEKARTLLASERPALSDGLAALGLEVVPGQANYLLFRAAGAADLKERMLMRGVLIRSCANYHGLGNDWYRVCVGQAEQNRRLLAALKEVL